MESGGAQLNEQYQELTAQIAAVFNNLEAAFGDNRGDSLNLLFSKSAYSGPASEALRHRIFSFRFLDGQYFIYAVPFITTKSIRFETWHLAEHPAAESGKQEEIESLAFQAGLKSAAPDRGEYGFKFKGDEGYSLMEKSGTDYLTRFWNYIQNREMDES